MGDPVCWLDRTCLSCGRFVEEEDFAVCPHCGSAWEDAGGEVSPAAILGNHTVSSPDPPDR